MGRGLSVAVLALNFALFWPAGAGAVECEKVQAAIDAQADASTSAEVLLRLGPHFSKRALPKLLALAERGPLERRLAAYGAFGLARHADGLRRITSSSAPADAGGRLGYSLATLALGVDANTATVTRTVLMGDVDTRRGAVRVLSRMKHVRPREILRDSLDDEDPEVRLTAAEALIRYDDRKAERVLLRMVADGDDDLRGRAVEALIGVRYRFSTARLRRLDPDLAARAYARSQAGRMTLSGLKVQILAREAGLRAGALAVAAAHRGASPTWLASATRRSKGRYRELGRGERTMAAALLGDAKAQQVLPDLGEEARVGALRVLYAFAETPHALTRVDTPTARTIAAGIEPWWPHVSERAQARLLRSLGRIDGPAALGFARRRLGYAVDGEPLIAVSEVFRAHGGVTDAGDLVAAVRGPSEPAHGPTLAAAARLCRLESGG